MDTDGDGLADGLEIDVLGIDPLSADTDQMTPGQPGPRVKELDPNDSRDALGDMDADGLTNADELLWQTDIQEPDSDGDSLLDGTEVHELGTDPTRADTDGDGLADDWR